MSRPISVWYNDGIVKDLFLCGQSDCDACIHRFKCYTDRNLVLTAPQAIKLWTNPRHWFTTKYNTKDFYDLLEKMDKFQRMHRPRLPAPSYTEGI